MENGNWKLEIGKWNSTRMASVGRGWGDFGDFGLRTACFEQTCEASASIEPCRLKLELGHEICRERDVLNLMK
jgi:hypothetical protein